MGAGEALVVSVGWAFELRGLHASIKRGLLPARGQRDHHRRFHIEEMQMELSCAENKKWLSHNPHRRRTRTKTF
jgi:hypothetical protein